MALFLACVPTWRHGAIFRTMASRLVQKRDNPSTCGLPVYNMMMAALTGIDYTHHWRQSIEATHTGVI